MAVKVVAVTGGTIAAAVIRSGAAVWHYRSYTVSCFKNTRCLMTRCTVVMDLGVGSGRNSGTRAGCRCMTGVTTSRCFIYQ